MKKANKKIILYIIIILAVLVVVLLVARWERRQATLNDFSSICGKYLVAAKEQEQAAYLPGAANNEVRYQLDQDLSKLLTENLTAAERLSLADQGLILAGQLEKQIDEMGNKKNPVERAIAEMSETAKKIKNSAAEKQTHEIIEMAREEMDIIADIRGLSYASNSQTKKIFNRVISDKGQLTDEHIIYLNQQISKAEKRFDAQRDLYDRLTDLRRRLEEKYRDLKEGV